MGFTETLALLRTPARRQRGQAAVRRGLGQAGRATGRLRQRCWARAWRPRCATWWDARQAAAPAPLHMASALGESKYIVVMQSLQAIGMLAL